MMMCFLFQKALLFDYGIRRITFLIAQKVRHEHFSFCSKYLYLKIIPKNYSLTNKQIQFP